MERLVVGGLERSPVKSSRVDQVCELADDRLEVVDLSGLSPAAGHSQSPEKCKGEKTLECGARDVETYRNL